MSFTTTLPEGVRLATADEMDSMPHPMTLPIFGFLCRHGISAKDTPWDETTFSELKREYAAIKHRFITDFSQGLAVVVHRGGTSGYEPLDMELKIEKHLRDWLATYQAPWYAKVVAWVKSFFVSPKAV